MTKKKTPKKNKIALAIAIIIILIGGGVLLFPQISQTVYNAKTNSAKAEFEEFCQTDNFDKLYAELQKRNEELYQNKQADLKDPFSYSQPDIDLTQYGISNNVIGYLTVHKMDICVPVILGSNDETLKKGATHLTQTSYPIGGENTNSVLAAHRGYGKAAMFRHIEKLEPGDKIYLENFRETLVYQVSEIKIIEPTDVNELTIKDNEDIITLITCHPYRVNTQRYVVYCTRITE